jgi:hypothetical protein
VPFTIKVLDSEEVNAFALPGGTFFFVNAGLIHEGETEAELAGVMGHEIARAAGDTAPGMPRAGKSRKSNDCSVVAILMAGRLRHTAGRRQSDPVGLPDLLVPMKGGGPPGRNTCTRPVTTRAFVDFFEDRVWKRKPGGLKGL